MPKHIPAPASRAAVVVTATATAALVAVLPAITAPAEAPASSVGVPSVPVTSPVALLAMTTPVPAAAGSPTAGVSAMNNALSKIGAPYRWGAAGPSAFDCSGLVSWAYRTAGISLPHSSRAMSRVGTPVSRADLRPGDLVFFYRPVSHVGIYLGDGRIVHASSRKSPVKISHINRMPFNSARRL